MLLNGGYSKSLIKKAINPSNSGLRYSNKEICEALILRTISTKAYELLRKNSILPLPSQTTLSERISHFRCEPGIQNDFFHLLKLQLSTLSDIDRQSMLLFDEMQISQSIEYCPRLKKVFPAYKKVQVVLLR